MAGLPTNVSTCTVTGRLAATEQTQNTDHAPDVIPLSGRVTFTANVSRLMHVATDTIFIPFPVSAELDSSGEFSATLIASDDPDINPTGWTYQATFQVNDVTIEPFNFIAGSDQVIDITDIIPVASSSGDAVARGESAYQAWLGQGNTGTEQDFLNTLKVTGLIGGLYTVKGNITTGVGSLRVYNDSGSTATISSVRASVGVAPVGRSIIVDAKVNDVSIFPTSPKPTITAGTNTGLAVPDTPNWPSGGYITIDVLQVGLSTPGADLVVSVTT